RHRRSTNGEQPKLLSLDETGDAREPGVARSTNGEQPKLLSRTTVHVFPADLPSLNERRAAEAALTRSPGRAPRRDRPPLNERRAAEAALTGVVAARARAAVGRSTNGEQPKLLSQVDHRDVITR